MKRRNTQHLAQLGLLTALALTAGYIELLIKVPIGIPGIKLGLANLITRKWDNYIGSKFGV